jgi:hypothetical protein
VLSTAHTLRQYYGYCFLPGIGLSAVSILHFHPHCPDFLALTGLAVGFINAGVGRGGFVAQRLATISLPPED